MTVSTALRDAAVHVRENRTKNIIEALVISVSNTRDYAEAHEAFRSWLSSTLSREVVDLKGWAESLPVVSTLVDYLSYAADDIERDGEVVS